MIFIIMGVCGCGKTTIGKALVKKLGFEFGDADDFHPEANKAKMSRSIPLTDEDRIPWLKAIHEHIRKLSEAKKDGVVTCSALKKIYRNILISGEITLNDQSGNLPVLFVYLKGSYDILRVRLAARKGHFMPATLLDSQLATLEEPTDEECAITVDVDNSVDGVVEEVILKAKVAGFDCFAK